VDPAERNLAAAPYRDHPDDVIYYADYSRGYLGRLDTKTGAIKEWPSPGGPKSQPYGITFADGAIWYSDRR